MITPKQLSQAFSRGPRARLATCVGLVLLASALAAPQAQAVLTITDFSASASTTDAGAHPDGSTAFDFQTFLSDTNFVYPSGGVARDLVFKLPPGFLGNARAVPQCTISAFQHLNCPQDTKVATGTVTGSNAEVGNGGPDGLGSVFFAPTSVYNLAPGNNAPALFGILVNLNIQPIGENRLGLQFLTATVHAADNYAVTLTVPEVTRPLDVRLIGASLTFWGVPADHNGGAENGEPRLPFIDNPTDCTATPSTTFSVNTYQDPTTYATVTAAAPVPTGCADVPFNPSVQLTPDSDKADDPTGLTFDLSLPQNNEPDGRRTSDLKKAVAKLPPGMTLSPPSVDGLTGCTPSQIGISIAHPNDDPATCPESSKIGTAEVDSPILPNEPDGSEGRLTGSVFVGRPEGGLNTEPPYTLYVELQGHGLEVKLKGTASPDPQTGQITTVFDNNPELPFDHFKLRFKDGPRAPLVTPSTCGRQTITTEMTPYSDPQNPVTPPSSFATSYDGNGAPCPASRPFGPSASAGTDNAVAAQTSPFRVKLTIPDGHQPIDSLSVKMPPGLAAYLKGVPFCPEAAITAAAVRTGAAEQADPSCPATSKLGTTITAAGAGSAPLAVAGSAYLAGPYKDAPLSVAFITPAVAGPFDLGNVIVHAGLYVDPQTAQITVRTSSIPHILGGVPLQLRTIVTNIDRPNFTLNPTNCDPMSVSSQLNSIFATVAALSNPFQLGGCSALPFKPKIAFKLKGGTHRGDHPAFSSLLTARPGEANIGAAIVALPHSEFLENAHIRTICTRVQFAADQCPPESVYGYARAITPLLDEPVEGPVILRSSDNPLPDLVAKLQGKISADLVGRIDSVNGGIRTSFEVVPDVPVTEFTLQMQGGEKGLFVNSRNLCLAPSRADVHFSAHNAKTAHLRPLVANDCARKRKGKRQQGRHRRG